MGAERRSKVRGHAGQGITKGLLEPGAQKANLSTSELSWGQGSFLKPDKLFCNLDKQSFSIQIPQKEDHAKEGETIENCHYGDEITTIFL